MHSHSSHLLIFLATALALLASHALIIHKVFAVYGEGPSWGGFDNKIAFRSDGKFAKTARVSMPDFTPQIYMIGSSRLRDGLSPQTAKDITGKRAFNYGMSGLVIKEMKPVIDHLIAQKNPQMVIIGLDFFAFNDSTSPAKDMVLENGIGPKNLLKMYFSEFGLKKSIEMMDLKGEYRGLYCGLDGFCEDTRFTPQQVSDYISQGLANMGNQGNPLHDYKSFDESLALFGTVLDDLKSHQIDAKFYFSPAHILQYRRLEEIGLINLHGEWKDSVTRMILAHGFEVHDFDIKSPVTTTPRDEAYSYFNDDLHYTKKTGNIILETLLSESGSKQYKNFSINLTAKNLPSVIGEQVENLPKINPEQY